MFNTAQLDRHRERWEARKRAAPKGHIYEDREALLSKAREAFADLYRVNPLTYAESRDGPLIPQVTEALPVSSGRGRDDGRRNRSSRKAKPGTKD